jgi:hypothetical protein
MTFHSFLSFLLLFISNPGSADRFVPSFPDRSLQDSSRYTQVLYNGRIWINTQMQVSGHQFLFSGEFLSGSISEQGRTYKNIMMRYDIFTDEMTAKNHHGVILQLNKEVIDSFTLNYNYRSWKFVTVTGDSTKGFTGYVNVLYAGKTAFYVKYRKAIELFAVDGKYDKFYDVNRMFFEQNGNVYQFSGRRQLLKLMGEHRKEVRSYINKLRLIIRKDNPESFIPVIKYYDSLTGVPL